MFLCTFLSLKKLFVYIILQSAMGNDSMKMHINIHFLCNWMNFFICNFVFQFCMENKALKTERKKKLDSWDKSFVVSFYFSLKWDVAKLKIVAQDKETEKKLIFHFQWDWNCTFWCTFFYDLFIVCNFCHFASHFVWKWAFSCCFFMWKTI